MSVPICLSLPVCPYLSVPVYLSRVHNNQEEDRDKVSANVDERTRFELYYEPFQGAVDAHVGSFMCSYNRCEHVCRAREPACVCVCV